jgi:hypothetical protein
MTSTAHGGTKLEDGHPKTKKCFPKTKSSGAAPELARSEVRRKRGRDNLAAEVEKLRIEVAVSRPSLNL